MSETLFNNESIISWLQYYAANAPVNLERVKLLDITGKNKSVIPAVESHRQTLVFTEAGDEDIFYRMWAAGLGECEVWYNDGSEPTGPIRHDLLKNMIDRGINASAGMLVLNSHARNTYKVGMDNDAFRRGSVHFVGSEIRAVLLNKMQVEIQDELLVISGESIAIEAAMLAQEGSVTAVEYNADDRRTLEDNIDHFGLHNIRIMDAVTEESMKNVPVPDTVMLVASASMEQELDVLTKLNPHIGVVIYTLDMGVAADIDRTFAHYGIGGTEVIQIAVSKRGHKNMFMQEPAPWIITGRADRRE